MNALVAWFRNLCPDWMIQTLDPALPMLPLQRRLLQALTDRLAGDLCLILADDVKLHLRCAVRQGRMSVLQYLEEWLGRARITASPPELRKLAVGLIALDADWLFDCPERGFFVERYTSLFALRDGRWQVVQLRLRASAAR